MKLMEPRLGLEPRTCCLQNSCSTTELTRHGAGCRIRTYELERGQIYSLLCLTASLTLHMELETNLRFFSTRRAKNVIFALASLFPREQIVKWSHDWDLNPRPPPYHGGALPLSYLGNAVQALVYQNRGVSATMSIKRLCEDAVRALVVLPILSLS